MAVFTILITIKDRKDKESTFEVNVPSTLTLATVTAVAQQLVALVDNVVTGAITRIGVSIQIPLPSSGIKTVADVGADVEEGAKFQFLTTNGFYTGFRLATFDEAAIAVDSRLVDQTDSDVADLIAAIISGITVSSVTYQFQDKRGEDIVSLDSALESFQNSRPS